MASQPTSSAKSAPVKSPDTKRPKPAATPVRNLTFDMSNALRKRGDPAKNAFQAKAVPPLPSPTLAAPTLVESQEAAPMEVEPSSSQDAKSHAKKDGETLKGDVPCLHMQLVLTLAHWLSIALQHVNCMELRIRLSGILPT